MKKLLYITRYSLDEEFNLKKKFDGQLSAFRNLGYDVYFIGFDRKNLYLVHNDEKTVCCKTHFGLPLYLHTFFYNDLHKASVKVIKEVGIDYVYWRSAPIFASSCKVAEAAKEVGAELIVEIPTFPSDKENNLNGFRKAFSVYSDIYSDRYNALVDVYAVIGDDAHGEYKGRPAINIDNGIDLKSIKVRNPQYEKNAVHILAVSAMRYWHGYDRLIKSIAAYKGDYNVFLHLVGGLDGECTNEWKQLAADSGVADKVIFHGYLYGDELDRIADICDLGCASLRRNNYDHISELKTREYTARGLPFILSLKDAVFDNAKKGFCYLIPNDGSIPEMDGIVDYALRTREDHEMISYMRKFAEQNLTWEIQYKKLFDKID